MENDASGNRYTFNAFNQLTTITLSSNDTINYTYYPNGLRASQTKGAESLYHFYNNKHVVINSSDNATTVGASYLMGLQREACVVGGRTSYYLNNQHSSVVGLVDDKGTSSTAYEYDTYGRLAQGALPDMSLTVNPFLYTAQATDSSGLYYLKSRYYNPEYSSFMSQDSYGLFNRYAYASGNPVMHTDPTGHMSAGEWVGSISAGIVASIATLGIGAPFIEGSFVAGIVLSAAAGVAGTAASDGVVAASHEHVNWGES